MSIKKEAHATSIYMCVYIYICSETRENGSCMPGLRCGVVKIIVKYLSIATSPLHSLLFAKGTEKRLETRFRLDT